MRPDAFLNRATTRRPQDGSSSRRKQKSNKSTSSGGQSRRYCTEIKSLSLLSFSMVQVQDERKAFPVIVRVIAQPVDPTFKISIFWTTETAQKRIISCEAASCGKLHLQATILANDDLLVVGQSNSFFGGLRSVAPIRSFFLHFSDDIRIGISAISCQSPPKPPAPSCHLQITYHNYVAPSQCESFCFRTLACEYQQYLDLQ